MISFQHLTANQTYVQSINYFSWTCSKLRSTPKSYLHTNLSRESFIRHLEYWFHHLLLVGCKHKHELIKRAHQYRSTNISWIVKHWKFFIKYSTMSQRHRPCRGAVLALTSRVLQEKSRRKAYNSCLSLSSWHRFCIIDYQKGEISNVPRVMLLRRLLLHIYEIFS